MGLPCIYTLDNPVLINIEGQVSASANPKISSGGQINQPHSVSANGKISVVISKKTQGRLGFISPFGHHHYLAGYDKNVQVYVPLRVQVEANVKNNQYSVQLQPIHADKNIQLFYYNSLPYTAKRNILQLQPVVGSSDTKIINAQQPNTAFNNVIGDRSTGVALRVHFVSEKKYLGLPWLYQQAKRHDPVSVLMAPWYDEAVYYAQALVEYDASHSANHQVKVQVGYQQHYSSQPQGQGGDEGDISQLYRNSGHPDARQKEFYQRVAAGISNAQSTVVDASVEFQGQQNVQYGVTIAAAYSGVDEKSRIIFYASKQPRNPQQTSPYQVALSVKNYIPNTNGLDYKYALNYDPKYTVQAQVAFGHGPQSMTKVNIHAELNKNKYRKQYLQQQALSYQCAQEMEQGNYQLPACENVTARANLLNQAEIHVQYQNVNKDVEYYTHELLNYLRHYFYYNLEEYYVDATGKGERDQMHIAVGVEPDFEAANVSINTERKHIQLNNIYIPEWAKPLVAVHPVFTVKDSYLSYALGSQSMRRK